MIQGETKQPFEEVKNELGLRPVYRQLGYKIEALIFVNYVTYCLLITLKNLMCPMANGLTLRHLLDKMMKLYIVDMKIPTTVGRELVMQCSEVPKEDLAIVLPKFVLRIPPQPPQRSTARQSTS